MSEDVFGGAATTADDEPSFTGDPLKPRHRSTLSSLFGGARGPEKQSVQPTSVSLRASSESVSSSSGSSRVLYSCTVAVCAGNDPDAVNTTAGLVVIVAPSMAYILLYDKNKTPIGQYPLASKLNDIRALKWLLGAHLITFPDNPTALAFAKWTTVALYQATAAKNDASSMCLSDEQQQQQPADHRDHVSLHVQEFSLQDDAPAISFEFLDAADVKGKRAQLEIPVCWQKELEGKRSGDVVVFVTDTPRKPPIFGTNAEDTLVQIDVIKIEPFIVEQKVLTAPPKPNDDLKAAEQKTTEEETVVSEIESEPSSETPAAATDGKDEQIEAIEKPSLKDRMAKIGRGVFAESTIEQDKASAVEHNKDDSTESPPAPAEIDVESIAPSEGDDEPTQNIAAVDPPQAVQPTQVIASHSTQLQYVQVPVLLDTGLAAKLDQLTEQVSKLGQSTSVTDRVQCLADSSTLSHAQLCHKLDDLQEKLHALEKADASPSNEAGGDVIEKLGALETKLDDLNMWQKRYEEVQTQLNEAQRSNAEMLKRVAGETHDQTNRSVRKILSRVYKTLSSQIDNDMTYSGAHLKQIMLEIIRESAQIDE